MFFSIFSLPIVITHHQLGMKKLYKKREKNGASFKIKNDGPHVIIYLQTIKVFITV